MKYSITIVSFCYFFSCYAQDTSALIETKSESISQIVKGYFNQDSILDLLIVFSSSKSSQEGMRSSLYLGDLNNSYTIFHESRNIFPHHSYTGRSDNMFDTLFLANNSIVWRTCNAPFHTSSYSIETFTFEYSNELKDFKLVKYETLYYPEPQDDIGISVVLNQSKLTPISHLAFSMTDWIVSNGYFSESNVKVYNEDLIFWDDLSQKFAIEHKYFEALSIQKMILYYFPENIGSLKKLGDYCWEYGDYDSAQLAYSKYLDFGGSVIGENKYISQRIKIK